MFNHKALCRGMAAALLISASTGLYAAQTTYNYTITGDVLVGDYGLSLGLEDGDTIMASGMFTVDDSFATNGGTVSFGAGSGNTMTIDLNGTFLDASLAASPFVEFSAGWTLYDFYFDATPAFYSSFTQFDDSVYSMYGEWRTDAAVTAVPEAETYAMMLAGLGLVGLMGAARRKSLQAAA